MKVSYEWLGTFFDEGSLPGVDDIEQKLVFYAYEVEGVEEVNGTSVLDIDVLPNRAADSLSHRGIAREISTLFGISMSRDPFRTEVTLTPETDSVKVTLDTSASCSYYSAAHIEGITVKESPDWLKGRLKAIGQKSINNVVDATNYVLFELGQPTHVFDAKKFKGEVPHVGTRLAKKGEKMTLLGNEEVALTESMTVIVDVDADTPIAVAGVKGGSLAEVSENTTDIIIESANFHPTQTRLTAQALKLRTDALTRFENNISDQLAQFGIVTVADLILQVAGGELKGYAHAGDVHTKNTPVSVTAQDASKLLGVTIDGNTIKDILKRLQFDVQQDGDALTVIAPFERRDINIKEDVIEEIGRVYGYNKIESAQLPPPEKSPGIHKKFAYAELIRNTLASLGFTEVYLYSLRDSGEVALLNSLASDKDHVRSDLSAGVIESLNKNEKNAPLLGLDDAVKIFEIGNVFSKDSEEMNVCLGVRVLGTKKHEERTLEKLKEAKSALEEELSVSLPQEKGETLEFSLDAILDDLPEMEKYPVTEAASGDIVYKPASQYPFVLRDIAVWVPENTDSEEIINVVQNHAKDLLARSDFFDVFVKDGRTSHAAHLVFQSNETTLDDEKVGDIMKAVEDEIKAKKDWEVR